jgi:hypothetical protein
MKVQSRRRSKASLILVLGARQMSVFIMALKPFYRRELNKLPLNRKLCGLLTGLHLLKNEHFLAPTGI